MYVNVIPLSFLPSLLFLPWIQLVKKEYIERRSVQPFKFLLSVFPEIFNIFGVKKRLSVHWQCILSNFASWRAPLNWCKHTCIEKCWPVFLSINLHCRVFRACCFGLSYFHCKGWLFGAPLMSPWPVNTFLPLLFSTC